MRDLNEISPRERRAHRGSEGLQSFEPRLASDGHRAVAPGAGGLPDRITSWCDTNLENLQYVGLGVLTPSPSPPVPSRLYSRR